MQSLFLDFFDYVKTDTGLSVVVISCSVVVVVAICCIVFAYTEKKARPLREQEEREERARRAYRADVMLIAKTLADEIRKQQPNKTVVVVSKPEKAAWLADMERCDALFANKIRRSAGKR